LRTTDKDDKRNSIFDFLNSCKASIIELTQNVCHCEQREAITPEQAVRVSFRFDCRASSLLYAQNVALAMTTVFCVSPKLFIAVSASALPPDEASGYAVGWVRGKPRLKTGQGHGGP